MFQLHIPNRFFSWSSQKSAICLCNPLPTLFLSEFPMSIFPCILTS
jgi:hypothetical protein